VSRISLLVLAAALASPALAHAAPATLVARDVPLDGARTLAGAGGRFTLVGLHWRGPGEVSFRTRSVSGRWSAWRNAAPEAEDLPDRTNREDGLERAGWRLGNPYWTGPSDALQVRTAGKVTRVRAFRVWSSPEPVPGRTIAQAGSPAVVPRLSWGANEAIKRAPPLYADTLAFAVVHHTAGANDYTRAQSAAIVKAIQLYHVQGNGWNDIGYNFLVDKYGQVFEGRYGGMTRNVIGAHAEGFNTGSVGVALLGNYTSAAPSVAARAAIASLLAWRLDLAHVDPLSTLNWISGGNPRFPRGVPVFLRAVSGHRDTGFTDCPGAKLYAQLGALAQAVSATGLPKLYAPAVKGAPGGLVRFTGRVSGAVGWTVSVRDSTGATVAEGSGIGPGLDWTWDATAAPAASYSWTIGGDGIRAAAGTFGPRASTALTVTNAAASPSAVTPNGDGVDDSSVISYRLSLPATVTAVLLDPAGTQLSTLFSEPRPAGDQSFVFQPQALADGTYRIQLTAVGTRGKTVTAAVDVLVNRVLSGLAASRQAFSPNGDGRLDTIDFRFTLASPAHAQLRILRDGGWVATPFVGDLAPGPQVLAWDGKKRLGRPLDGTYAAELTVSDVVGSIVQSIPFVVDSTAPKLRLLSTRPLRLQIGEAGSIVVVADGKRRVVKAAGPGAYAVPGVSRPRRVRAVAWDAAGNSGPPLLYPARR
jgi:uncharacterized protein with LGFP repeats